jgi:hypothetical protein
MAEKPTRTMNTMYYSNHSRTHNGEGWGISLSEFRVQKVGEVKINNKLTPIRASFSDAGKYLKNFEFHLN